MSFPKAKLSVQNKILHIVVNKLLFCCGIILHLYTCITIQHKKLHVISGMKTMKLLQTSKPMLPCVVNTTQGSKYWLADIRRLMFIINYASQCDDHTLCISGGTKSKYNNKDIAYHQLSLTTVSPRTQAKAVDLSQTWGWSSQRHLLIDHNFFIYK